MYVLAEPQIVHAANIISSILQLHHSYHKLLQHSHRDIAELSQSAANFELNATCAGNVQDVITDDLGSS